MKLLETVRMKRNNFVCKVWRMCLVKGKKGFYSKVECVPEWERGKIQYKNGIDIRKMVVEDLQNRNFVFG